MNKWNFKKAREAALTCEWRAHFDRKYAGAALWAKRNGRYDEVVDGLKTFVAWDADSVRSAARECKTVSEFQRKYAGALKWAKRHGIWQEIKGGFDEPFVWTFDLVQKEATKYESRNEFYQGNSSAAQWATRNKVMDRLFPHKLTFWDLDSCKAEAEKYQSREEFRTSSPGASQWASRNGVWEEVCEHMEHLNRLVTEQECIEEASKYKTKADFSHGSPRCYAWALRNKDVMERACAHMQPGSTASDKDVIYLWSPDGHADVYKVGYTSRRIGDRRIRGVCSAGGFEPSLVVMRHAPDAGKVERELLSLGEPYDFGRKFSGCTEFRRFSPRDVTRAFDLIAPYEEIAL